MSINYGIARSKSHQFMNRGITCWPQFKEVNSGLNLQTSLSSSKFCRDLFGTSPSPYMYFYIFISVNDSAQERLLKRSQQQIATVAILNKAHHPSTVFVV